MIARDPRINVKYKFDHYLSRAELAGLVLGWITTLVFAQQLGTAKDARAMLDRAIAALKRRSTLSVTQQYSIMQFVFW
jgi:hypothetical protein